jgi:hypothetical protein
MQNESTTVASLSNRISNTAALTGLNTNSTSIDNQEIAPAVIVTAVLKYPVLWEDISATWNAYHVTWNSITDVTPLTNL